MTPKKRVSQTQQQRTSAPPSSERRAPDQQNPPAMARAYFLLVSPNEGGGRRFIRLKVPTVLAWFQRAWRAAKQGEEWDADLPGDVYGLATFFDRIDERHLPFPSTEKELMPLLEQHVYYEKDIEVEPHFVHVQTDDDEVDIEYYFFDDEFLKSPGALDRLPPAERPPREQEDEEYEDADDDDEEEDAYARFIRKLSDE